jgi:hypothetical protein
MIASSDPTRSGCNSADGIIWKAFCRKGCAQLELGDYIGSRESLREAAWLASSESDKKAVRRELRRLQEMERTSKKSQDQHKRALMKAMVCRIHK